MKRWLLIAAHLACIAAAGPLVSADVRAQAGAPSRPETKDHLRPERMEALVAGPMARVRAGDVAGGERAFETLLEGAIRRHGAGSVEAADLLMSFGITVYTEGLRSSAGTETDGALRARALPYLRRSIDAYRSALGPNHPLVAVASHSLADGMTDLAPDNPPAEAEAALEEAYRIRLAALGPANPETWAAMASLAHIRSLPSRTGGNPARIAAVAAMYREGLAYARRALGQFPEEQPRLWYARLARMYVRNGQAAAALQIIDEAEREGGTAACLDMSMLVADVARLLDEQGFATEAEALSRRYPIERTMDCLDRSDLPMVEGS
jgi:tetratricopeptide (TPR) repeat protein